MTAFFTSDQHFGHQNIIRYCGRPFPDVEAMNAGLIAKWNEVVGPDDAVHVLGDVAMGVREKTLPLVSRLNGHKILYPGNHDRCWYGHGSRGIRREDEYLGVGFEAIRQGPVPMSVAGRSAILCHLPYQGDSQDEDRFDQFRPVDDGRWLIHGHVHSKWRQLGRMINVGVDVWDFKPVSEANLAELMSSAPTSP